MLRQMLTSDANKLLAVVVVFLSTLATVAARPSSAGIGPGLSAERMADPAASLVWQADSESGYLPVFRSTIDLLDWLTGKLKLYQETLAFGAAAGAALAALLMISQYPAFRVSPRLCDQARHERSGVLLV